MFHRREGRSDWNRRARANKDVNNGKEVFVGFLLFAGPADAIQFSPIEMSFTPTGRESVRTFRLENDTDEPIAVEISVFGRGMTPGGDDKLVPSEDEFIVVSSK